LKETAIYAENMSQERNKTKVSAHILAEEEIFWQSFNVFLVIFLQLI